MPALHRSSARLRAFDGDCRARTVTTGRRLALTAACAGAAAVVLVGCGSSSSPSGSSTGTGTPAASGTAAVCTQAGELQASLRQLTSINVVQQGTNGVKAAADDVQTQFNDLKQSASDQYAVAGGCLAVGGVQPRERREQPGQPVQPGPSRAAIPAPWGRWAPRPKALADAISSSCPSGIPSVSASPQSTSS